MRRLSLLIGLCALALCAGGVPALAQTPEQVAAKQTYDRYAPLRQQLMSCRLARQVNALTKEESRDCRKLFRTYSLFTWPSNGTEYYIHCNTSKCVPAPAGAPSPTGAYPSGAWVLRWNGPAVRV